MSLYTRKSGAVTALALAGAFAASLLGAAPSAHATFVLGTGNIGGLGDNVIINACDSVITGPAPLVQGCLNTSHSTNVDVSTAGGGNLEANGGQARFDASGGNITNFTINFNDPSLGFSGIVFNINADADSDVTFTVNAVDALGNIELPQIFVGTLDSAGNNFFNLTSADGEVALNVTVTSSLSNIVDIRQVRIEAADIPLPPIQVPEPASLAMLGGALIGFGLLRRRKRA